MVPAFSLQVVEFNSSSSLLQQLLVVKDSGVYVSVHTSNLANTPFLQPGSAVVEIIQVGKGALLVGFLCWVFLWRLGGSHE